MSTPTQKQALEEAQTKITELEGKVSAAEGLQTKLDEATNKLSAAETLAGTEKTRADQAEQKTSDEKTRADGLQTRLDEAGTQLSEANGKIGATEKERDAEKTRAEAAENKLKTADQDHSEKMAGRGIKPFQKAAASAENEGKEGNLTADEIKAHYATIEDKTERYAYFEKNKAALMS